MNSLYKGISARLLACAFLAAAVTPSAAVISPPQSFLHGGMQRWFIEGNSSAYIRGNPVLILLHGGLSNMHVFGNLEGASQATGAMIISPQAVDAKTLVTKDGAFSLWNCLESVNPVLADAFYKVDDVGFLKALAKWAVDVRGADPNRVYIAGPSNGGAMIYRALMETFPPVYAAAASAVAPLPIWNRGFPKFNTTTPLFVMMGTQDRAVKWEGGIIGENLGYNAGIGMSGLKVKEFWLTANMADPTKVQRSWLNAQWWDGCNVEKEVFPAIDSTKGAPVEFYTVHGGGHFIPMLNLDWLCWFWSIKEFCPGGYEEWKWGPACADMDTGAAMWAFLSKYTLKKV
jgi:poly(3-hydroxybutyrate) depolymerase